MLLVTTGKIQVTGAAPHVDRGQHKLLGNQGEAPTFQPQELTITRCHLRGHLQYPTTLLATLEAIVPSNLQISGRGARGSRQGEPGSTCSSLNPLSPTASAPGAEPTFLEATPSSLSIHYNPGNMQEGPCIRRGGVNGPSLSRQSQACRLLPSEGRVGSIGCWSTPPLSSVQLLSAVLPFLTLWTGARQASLSITHSSSSWSFFFFFCIFPTFI